MVTGLDISITYASVNKCRLRIGLERLWLRFRAGVADDYIVQTPSMKALLESRIANGMPVHVLPFVENAERYERSGAPPRGKKDARFDFVYVASGEPHKNHRNLIDAWCLLATEGIFPSLCLTISGSDFKELHDWVNAKKSASGLRLENAGQLSGAQVDLLYKNARALIFPSLLESLGLPLIEARRADLPVVASELDYVRDVLDPEETFDPTSPESIARAVKRFMGFDEPALPLSNAAGFMRQIIQQAH